MSKRLAAVIGGTLGLVVVGGTAERGYEKGGLEVCGWVLYD